MTSCCECQHAVLQLAMKNVEKMHKFKNPTWDALVTEFSARLWRINAFEAKSLGGRGAIRRDLHVGCSLSDVLHALWLSAPPPHNSRVLRDKLEVEGHWVSSDNFQWINMETASDQLQEKSKELTIYELLKLKKQMETLQFAIEVFKWLHCKWHKGEKTFHRETLDRNVLWPYMTLCSE